MLPPHYQVIMNRFVAACQADARVVAATLYGSYASGTADAYSDLDLGLIITDAAYENFIAERETFLRLLGELLLLEDFDLPHLVFVIFPGGIEIELALGRASQFQHTHGGPYRVLLDKTNLLAGAVFPRSQPAPAEPRETLRRLLYWFWHDLSHFIAAMGRGQIWWAYGQLETLRRYCVNLVRLRHDFSGAADGYDKIEKAIPGEDLASLQATCCPLEPGAMLQAVLVIVRFYQELAPLLARTHGIPYPAELARELSGRLEQLCTARLR
jgi:predicted nucleotidyltransferase